MNMERKSVMWRRATRGYTRKALPDSEPITWDLGNKEVLQILLEYMIWLRDNLDRVWKAVDRLEQKAAKHDPAYQLVLPLEEEDIDNLEPGSQPAGGQSGPGD
jgi:hypothetical protein